MAEQLRFDLPFRPALGRGDFYISVANALASRMVDSAQLWPGGKLVLVGPAGSGKTHLAHVWSTESGARILAATDLPDADIPALAEGPVCVEDVSAIAGDAAAEEALFHLHNLVLAQGHRLLVTARTPPAQWALHLPDLASRMTGTQTARLEHPDDDLLAAVMAKLFADRQIVPAPDVLPYLVRHMSRSFDMARQLVTELDKEALGRPRGVSRNLARTVLIGIEEKIADSGK
ncbi:DnaA ATPase domain-containing protein [Puniceibacterium sp. IMCC21224]|uniref:DnaA ATPase domain-containing protein n=1 Tax=Puniceibacterium sp. IMCC21224 TaxID=1618204 RepID=UPI00064D9521|nr:DnaA/Hda family protein [Puniceibacterium sp. IMCC21224]KMK67673.1 Bacterial dnaA protein [Puniceibacterium sp. IMCC21224]